MAKKNKYIKEMEANVEVEMALVAPLSTKEAEAEKPKVAAVNKMHFDGWWSLRKDAIPSIHKKEIVKADFLARKVPAMATMAEFDEALKKYGVVL